MTTNEYETATTMGREQFGMGETRQAEFGERFLDALADFDSAIERAGKRVADYL